MTDWAIFYSNYMIGGLADSQRYSEILSKKQPLLCKQESILLYVFSHQLKLYILVENPSDRGFYEVILCIIIISQRLWHIQSPGFQKKYVAWFVLRCVTLFRHWMQVTFYFFPNLSSVACTPLELIRKVKDR